MWQNILVIYIEISSVLRNSKYSSSQPPKTDTFTHFEALSNVLLCTILLRIYSFRWYICAPVFIYMYECHMSLLSVTQRQSNKCIIYCCQPRHHILNKWISVIEHRGGTRAIVLPLLAAACSIPLMLCCRWFRCHHCRLPSNLVVNKHTKHL